MTAHPHTICFASPKGGSGKTVTAIAFAQVLVALGQGVLLVDTDADTSGLTLFFLDKVLQHKKQLSPAAGGIFDNEPSIHGLSPLSENLGLIPSQYSSTVIPSDSVMNLADRLRGIQVAISNQSADEAPIHYLLLDAQAGVDDCALAAASVADEVVIVSEFDPVSVQGIRRMERLAPLQFNSETTWVLYNKVLPELFQDPYGLLKIERKLPSLPWDVDVLRAYMNGRSAIDMDVPNAYSLAVIGSIEIMLATDLREAIESWRNDRSTNLRAPLDSRAKQLEKEMQEVEAERIQLRSNEEALKSTRRRLAFVRPGVTALATLIPIMALGVGAIVQSGTAKSVSWWAPTLLALLAAFSIPVVVVFQRELRLDRRADRVEGRGSDTLYQLNHQMSSLKAEYDKVMISRSEVSKRFHVEE